MSLSDLNGHDPGIHQGTPVGVLRCILDCFGTPSGSPPLSALEALTRSLTRIAVRLQKKHQVEDPFHPYLFRRLVTAAAQLSRRQGLLQ